MGKRRDHPNRNPAPDRLSVDPTPGYGDESPFWPFKGLERNECYGPGRRGGKNCRRDRWACKCHQVNKDLSICKCISTRILKNGKPSTATKTVRINLRKKRKRQAQDRAARRRS